MKRAIKQSTLTSILNGITITFAVLVIIFFTMVITFHELTLTSAQNQLFLNNYAQQFIDASALLTEKVRAYAVTGNQTYYNEYMQEVNTDKNREKSVQAMEDIGITDDELAIITEMSNLSNELVPLETSAMEEVNAGNNASAISYVYGSDYSNTLSKIHALQDQLLENLQTRTENEINSRMAMSSVLKVLAIIVCIGTIVSQIFGIVLTRKRIINPINKIQKEMLEMSKGNLTTQSELQADTSELGMLISSMQTTRRALSSYIVDIKDKLSEISKGNLTQKVTLQYVGEFSEIKNALENIISSLNSILYSIDDSAQQVNSNASQVANGAQALAQGSTEQASAVQELAATINDVSNQIKGTETSVQEAMNEIDNSNMEVYKCNEMMNDMTDDMNEIREASKKIVAIIKTIEDIAFQTNILALNAAVEAARAGAAGKGFAVVADEVRNLASKSAQASQQTSQIIEISSHAVDKGVNIASQTADALANVVEGIQRSDKLMGDISCSVKEQSEAISQISEGINQISVVVQTNSATSEESAAASVDLGEQAGRLKELVSQFKLR